MGNNGVLLRHRFDILDKINYLGGNLKTSGELL
jgi:hypothetical protein